MSNLVILPDFCILSRASGTTNGAGQPVYVYASGVKYKCEFENLATDDNSTPIVEDREIVEIKLSSEASPGYNDLITNIQDRYGNIILPGPFQVKAIKRYVTYRGKLRFYRLRTKVVHGLC